MFFLTGFWVAWAQQTGVRCQAMVDEAKKTTLADLWPVLETALKVVGGFVLLAQGNVLVLMGVGWFFYKKRQAAAQA